MKYKERDALVAGLREAADFFEAKGLELGFVPSVTIDGWIPSYDRRYFKELTKAERKRVLKRAVRAMKPVEKEYSGSTLYVKRKFGSITFVVRASREVACKAVKTGNKIVHAGQWIPERTEEEVEWVCTDPLLKATGTDD